MTATLQRPEDAAPPQRRSTLALVAVGVVVVAVVGLTAVFGVQRPPELDTIADQPGPPPPEAVAWTNWRDDETCLYVATPTGEVTTPWCSSMGGELVAWTEDGQLVLRTWEGRGQLRTLDPQTATFTGRLDDEQDAVPPAADAVWTERDGDELVVRDLATDAELWRTAAPDRYTIHGSGKSADGGWIVMVDSAERLLVVPTDGGVAPRVWADDVPGWPSPVWRSVVLSD